MPQLNLETFASQIFWLFLLFSIMYLFVSRHFVPKIGKIVENRKSAIKNNINKADKFYADHKAINLEIKELIDSSRSDSATMKKNVLKETEELYNRELFKIEKEISAKMVTEEQRLARFKATLEKEIKDISGTIASEIRDLLIGSDLRKN